MPRITRTVQVIALSVLSLSFGHLTSIRASEQQRVRIHVVDYPRPVAAAVRQVETHFAHVVTYEDTRYVNPGDILDVTEEISRDRASTKRIYARKPGTINFSFAPSSEPAAHQILQVLRGLIAHANGKGLFGKFAVEPGDGAYHIIPVAIRGKKGSLEAYASPLETYISFAADNEDGLELMFRLADTISSFSGVKVRAGTMPLNRFAQARVSVSAEGERARDVLWRALKSIDAALSWQMLCDVGEDGLCAINIHEVRKR